MKKAFVLLEAMNHMSFVLKEAKRRGFHIVLLNHNPVPQTGPYAMPMELVDELIPIASWQDPSAVTRILVDLATRHQVVGTYAGFEATLPFEASLRQLAGLANNGEGNVRSVLDKGAVRKKLYREGLSRLSSVSLTEARTWDAWKFKGSAVLKPVNGTGSALCFVVSSMEELHAAARKVEEAAVINPLMKEYITHRGDFVLEEKAQGELLSVESLVYHGEVHFIGLSSRYVLASDPVVEMGCTFPYSHPRLKELVAFSKAVHQSMGLYHGPTHLEVMVPSIGDIEVIDFNIRFAGVESLVCFNHSFGLKFEACLTDLACDQMPDLSFLSKPTRFSGEVMLLPPPGATVMRELEFPPEVVFSRSTKELGKELTGRTDQLDHVGVAVVVTDAEADLHEAIMKMRRRVVFGGQPLGNNINNEVVGYGGIQ